MSVRTFIRRPNRSLCIGDMTSRIKLNSRALTEPVFGEVDATEDFTCIAEVSASIKTTPGKALFAGVAGDVVLSHEISIRYRQDITSEVWVELRDGSLLDIIDIENLEERNEWLKLRCNQRGNKDLEAARA